MFFISALTHFVLDHNGCISYCPVICERRPAIERALASVFRLSAVTSPDCHHKELLYCSFGEPSIARRHTTHPYTATLGPATALTLPEPCACERACVCACVCISNPSVGECVLNETFGVLEG